MPNKDPAMIASEFSRRDGDRYWTEPWVTRALLRSVFGERIAQLGCTSRNFRSVIWEPACGRGDMVKELVEHEYEVVATDVDLSDWDDSWQAGWVTTHQRDFLDMDSLLDPPDEHVTAIITNPPYGTRATDFVRRALEHMDDRVSMVAMLMRSEYYHGSGKRDGRNEFFEDSRFAGKLDLTARPRWDDWLHKPKPDASPRHNYSWYVWSDMGLTEYPISVRGGRS